MRKQLAHSQQTQESTYALTSAVHSSALTSKFIRDTLTTGRTSHTPRADTPAPSDDEGDPDESSTLQPPPTPPRKSLKVHGRRRWTTEGNRYIQRLPLEFETLAGGRMYLKRHPETEDALRKHNTAAPWKDASELSIFILECRRSARRTRRKQLRDSND